MQTDELDQLLTSYSAEVRTLTLALRDRILDLVPDARETIRTSDTDTAESKAAMYSVDGRMETQICSLIPQTEHVNVQFARGVQLDDPEGVLEGSGKTMRHVEVTSLPDTESEALASLIRQAADLAKEGK